VEALECLYNYIGVVFQTIMSITSTYALQFPIQDFTVEGVIASHTHMCMHITRSVPKKTRCLRTKIIQPVRSEIHINNNKIVSTSNINMYPGLNVDSSIYITVKRTMSMSLGLLLFGEHVLTHCSK
jgi:hypothetical protein